MQTRWILGVYHLTLLQGTDYLKLDYAYLCIWRFNNGADYVHTAYPKTMDSLQSE